MALWASSFGLGYSMACPGSLATYCLHVQMIMKALEWSSTNGRHMHLCNLMEAVQSDNASRAV
jgi:hypothetical protein